MAKLPNIEIKLDGIEYAYTFSEDISVDRTNLEEELSTQAEKYYYYAYLATTARTKALFKKAELEQMYARVDNEKRNLAKTVPGFKYTEKMCENEVITDPRYVALQTAYFEADLLANQLDECARAMAQRRDMLIQLGGITRQTMSPTRVVEQQRDVAETLIAKTRERSPSQPLPGQMGFDGSVVPAPTLPAPASGAAPMQVPKIRRRPA